ncbi:hypothetical protein [Sphingomonas sp. LaA6.9]|uniref:hypothetical protein n=1 Tax=Sphingomonas sp. LaA6.9 TaxID=2919914 RepID=UPI001F500C96|nr:hypothetical protein [Sphingomonas sp. LaA6.9]MCJ8158838.1 hypothetical protein [Sphingomonas sp. LaA6.9]
MKGATHKALRDATLARSAIVQRNRKAAAQRKKLRSARLPAVAGDVQPGTAKGDYSIREILDRLKAREAASQ